MTNYPGYPECLRYPWAPNYNTDPRREYETRPLDFRTEIQVEEDGRRILYLMPRKAGIGHCFLKAAYQVGSYRHGESLNDIREKIDVQEGELFILYITDNGSGLDICSRKAGESWYSGAEERVAVYGPRAEAELFRDRYPETTWPEEL